MKHSTTPEQKKEWKRLEKAASAGPWTTDRYAREGEVWSPMKELLFESAIVDPVKYKANADFIAGAREAVPALLKEVAELEERNRVLEKGTE